MTDADEPVRRMAEIEDFTNLYFIHPIANRLTRLLAAAGVRPNTVSIAGMGCGVLAGVAYAHYEHIGFAVAGFVLMIAWHVLDGADGQLARLTRTQSQSGKILDGICDYTTFTAVYAGLALALAPRFGPWVCALIFVSGACHAVQSSIYEGQRQEYGFWGWGRAAMDLLAPQLTPARRIPDLLHRIYLKFQLLTVGDIAGRRRRLEAAMALDPRQAPAIRRRYRDAFAPSLRRWSVLSANTRSLAIFVCVLLKAPLAFFWFEIIGLGLITIILLASQRAHYDRFLADLPAGDVRRVTAGGVESDREPRPSAKAAA